MKTVDTDTETNPYDPDVSLSKRETEWKTKEETRRGRVFPSSFYGDESPSKKTGST